MKINARFGFIGLIIMVGLLTTVTADDGTPASLDCQFTLTSNASTDYAMDLESRAVGPDNAYYVVVQIRDKIAPLDVFHTIYRINQNCSVAWAEAPDICADTAGADTCIINRLYFDHAGRIVATIVYVPGGGSAETYIEVKSAAAGGLIKRSIDLATLSPSWTDIRGITSVKNGTNDLDYIVVSVGTDRIMRMNSALTQVKYSVALTNPDFIFCCDEYETEAHVFVGAATSGSAASWHKVDATTGATVASASNGARFTGVDEHAPLLGYVDDTKAFGIQTSGSAGNIAVSHQDITVAGWSGSTTQFTPSQMWHTGSYRYTATTDYDLDGADNLLACGYFTVGSEQYAYAGFFRPSDDHFYWNVTVDLGTTFTHGGMCAMDYDGDFWFTVNYFNTGSGDASVNVRHYEGGELTPIIDRRATFVLNPDETTAPAGNIIRRISDNASEAWGFDWSWIIGGIIVGGVVWGVRNGKLIVIAIMAFIGVGIAVSVGMFPEWLIFVIVFLIIASAGAVLFGGRGERDED